MYLQGTHWGGSGQDSLGAIKGTYWAYLADTKRKSVLHIGGRCRADMIESVGTCHRFELYISKHGGYLSLSPREPQI
jgi:hypothetical protein